MDALGTLYYPETITVYATAISGSDNYGKPSATMTARLGLTGVPAAAGIGQRGAATAIMRAETPTAQMVRSEDWWRLQTPGDHHEITQSDWVSWRGSYWNVDNVAVDPTGSFTEMLVQRLNPQALPT